jgi:hypothetical protein
LGAFVTYTLKEDFEIKTSISTAWGILGAMKHFFKAKDVDLRAKALLYIGGPINALLWGAKSWNLSKKNLNKLNIFHHSAMRWILGINMERVKNERIKNISTRKAFCNLPSIEYYIKRRVWNYIGKIVRQEVSTLRTMIPGMSKHGKFNEFFKLV